MKTIKLHENRLNLFVARQHAYIMLDIIKSCLFIYANVTGALLLPLCVIINCVKTWCVSAYKIHSLCCVFSMLSRMTCVTISNVGRHITSCCVLLCDQDLRDCHVLYRQLRQCLEVRFVMSRGTCRSSSSVSEHSGMIDITDHLAAMCFACSKALFRLESVSIMGILTLQLLCHSLVNEALL